MRVSLEWLGEYVDIALSPSGLAELLSMSGTAVDRVIPAGAGVSGVVVARVREVRPHPNADRLRLALVEDGRGTREVVCGAPNLVEGMLTALAVPGAILPAVSPDALKRTTIRGVESDGMLLSAVELGLGEDASGIVGLDEGSVPGTDIGEVLPVEDHVLDLEITPNRPDCMSMVGIAREVAALTGGALKLPPVRLDEEGPPAVEMVAIEVEDRAGCPRYTARVVTGVTVAPSPPWMQRRLIASGMRPINNVVDVTNYVLMEVGQPLHAFDLELLKGRRVTVRRARHGETILTLDGVERQLDDQSLVIADAERSVAMAGVMGGEDSEVVPSTRNVLIESAYFDPTAVYLTSRRLGLRTEASSRFERGADPGGTAFAAARAAMLMAQLAGGTVAPGEVDVYPAPVAPKGIELRASRVRKITGLDLSPERIEAILLGLGFETSSSDPLRVAVPTFRPDIEREIDLVEEVARIHGYDRIPSGLPGGGGVEAGLKEEQGFEERVARTLASCGMLEALTYSFMRLGDLDLMRLAGDDGLRKAVRLMNPVAETGEVMRTTLLPGLIRVASGNTNRGNRDLALFEIGTVFEATGGAGLPVEGSRIGLLACGSAVEAGWAEPTRMYDFYDLKGIVENLCCSLRVAEFSFAPDECPFLVPGLTARLEAGGRKAGLLGQLHPEVVSGFGLEGELFVAELDTGVLLRNSREVEEYRPVSRFPNVKVDIALVVDEGLGASAVEDEILRSGGEHLRSVRLFDVYVGPQLPGGKKSLAFALEFESAERTLTDEETHREVNTIVDAVEGALGASLRGRRPLAEGDG